MAAISRWRTPEDAHSAPALIGPNAILQLLPVLVETLGEHAASRLMVAARLGAVPDGNSMVPESDAARLHRQVRLDASDQADLILSSAGHRTADYILANRIPRLGQRGLRVLPPGPSAKLLSLAIARHAWTFAGSGQFEVLTPWHFRILDNPLIRSETSAECLCHWHAAVFERLYRVLAARDCRCLEIACAAQTGRSSCEFRIDCRAECAS